MTRQANDDSARVAPDDPLAPVIADAYRVFADRRPTTLGVCEGCCMYPEIEADFFNHASRELPLHYIQDWYGAAWEPPHVPKETWMHLLPRILEIVAAGDAPDHVGLEPVLKRFPSGDASQWTADQWDVLQRFQVGFLDRYRDPDFSDEYLDDVLCMFGLSAFPVDELCRQVWSWSDEDLVARLHHDWCAFGDGSIWISFFWEGDAVGQTHAFYTSTAMQDRLTRIALEGSGPTAELALEVAAVLA